MAIFFKKQRKNEKIIKEKQQQIGEILKNNIHLEIEVCKKSEHLPAQVSPEWCNNTLPIQLFFEAGILDIDPDTGEIENDELAAKRNLKSMPDYEIEFFKILQKQTIDSGFSGKYAIRQMSKDVYDITFTNDEITAYIGKVKLRLHSPQYAVIKKGSKRAGKIFQSEIEVVRYIEKKKDPYIIEKRDGSTQRFLEYRKTTKSGIYILENVPYENYITGISHWIDYLKYLKYRRRRKYNSKIKDEPAG